MTVYDEMGSFANTLQMNVVSLKKWWLKTDGLVYI